MAQVCGRSQRGRHDGAKEGRTDGESGLWRAALGGPHGRLPRPQLPGDATGGPGEALPRESGILT